jgi:hypothetical protein
MPFDPNKPFNDLPLLPPKAEGIFREQAELDMGYLAGVLQRHGLEGKWKQWTP